MADLGLSLAAAAVKIACKIWLRDHAVAADASIEVADILKEKIASDRDRRKVQRQFDQIEETVADRITAVLGHEFRGLGEGERNAAVWQAHNTLQHARLTDIDLFDADLDPIYLERHIRSGTPNATRDLSEVGTALYNRVLTECCTDIVELTTMLPEFGPAAFTEILRRETKLIDMVRDLLDRVPAREVTDLRATADAEFAAAYRAQIVNRLDRLRLFGITQATQRYPLSMAYISLNVDTRASAMRGTLWDSGQPSVDLDYTRRPQGADGPVRVERVLVQSSRLLIRGDAGSGKTTLLQWLAVRCARYDFDDSLAPWNSLVPFFIQLRNYANRDLPEPIDFVKQIGRHLAETVPQGWITDLMRRGLAALLIDGVDELPARQRQAARLWLGRLIEEFPDARYVVTSRPAAISEEWLQEDEFIAARLEPMSPTDVAGFVHKWHEAVRSEIVDSVENSKLELCEHKMQEALSRERRLRQLATNPLMCALLCALHRDREGQLPRDRMEIYDAALEMLLERRDSERGVADEISGLTRRRKMIILQALAYWLMRNGWSNGSYEGAQTQVINCLSLMSDVTAEPAIVLRQLLERSGVVREPAVGRIDFIHRTFQEYLAARGIIDTGDLGVLLEHADDDLWHEVFVLAVGYSGDAAREDLLKNLLRLATNASGNKRAKLHLVALACLETAPQVPAIERDQIEEATRQLLPPVTMTQAETLAKSGEFALGLLMNQPVRTAKQAAATIRAASLIGGDEALQLIRKCSERHTEAIRTELIRAWPRFDPVKFARDVLARTHLHMSLVVTDPAILPAMQYVQPIELTIEFPDGHGDISSVAPLANLKYLSVIDPLLNDLKPLRNCAKLSTLKLYTVGPFDLADLYGCRNLRNLSYKYYSAVAPGNLRLFEKLTNLELGGVTSFSPVRKNLPLECRLRRFGMRQASDVTDLREMVVDPRLSELDFLLLGNAGKLRSISGIETLNETLTGIYLNAPKLTDYQQLSDLRNLNFVNIAMTPISDLSFIRNLQKIEVLHLGGVIPVPDLEVLLELPRLRKLFLRGRGNVNLTPLAGKENLEVHVGKEMKFRGSERFGSNSKVIRDRWF